MDSARHGIKRFSLLKTVSYHDVASTIHQGERDAFACIRRHQASLSSP